MFRGGRWGESSHRKEVEMVFFLVRQPHVGSTRRASYSGIRDENVEAFAHEQISKRRDEDG